MEDLASEISKKQEQIDKFTQANKPKAIKYEIEERKEAQQAKSPEESEEQKID